MITWKEQGPALVGDLRLAGDVRANAVLVGPRDNPRGAVLVVARKDQSGVDSIPLADALDKLSPDQVIDIMCMQERAFGDHDLAPPVLS